MEKWTYGLKETNLSDELKSKHQSWLTPFNIRFLYLSSTKYVAESLITALCKLDFIMFQWKCPITLGGNILQHIQNSLWATRRTIFMVLYKLCRFYYESIWLKARITQHHLTKASHILLSLWQKLYMNWKTCVCHLLWENNTVYSSLFLRNYCNYICCTFYCTIKFLHANFYSITLVQWDNEITAMYNKCITAIYNFTLSNPSSLAPNRDFNLFNCSLLSSSSFLKPSSFSSSWFCMWRRSASTESPASQFWDTGSWRKRRW